MANREYYELTKTQKEYIKVKTIIGRTMAGVGLVVLAPVFLGIVAAIKIEDGIKAPVFFKQKRVGIDQKHFGLYKFRSMKLDTPHDMPTHLLSNPEQYITKVGKFLRKSSLDELPQLINIAKGEMAVCGPRPALWNQDDLIEAREEYGVHQILPGLTGWAQIHGRDELEIDEKAKLDAYYLKHIGPMIDIRCFFGTILSVAKSDGVVEGGTGELKKQELQNKELEKKISNKKVIFVANVSKEHILKFHVPTLKMLSDEGWQVDVACSGDESVPYCNQQFKLPHKRNPFHPGTIVSIVQLRRILKKGNYDILSCHTPTGGIVARVATLGLKDRPYVIYTAHGFHFYKGAPLLNWLLFFPVEWLLGHITDELVVINNEDYNNALKYKLGMKKITLLCGMGVDYDRFQRKYSKEEKEQLREELGISEDAFVFTYVAEIIKNKNQKTLVKALKLLRRKFPNAVLLLVGPIHDDGLTQKQVGELDLEKNVIFTGWRDDIERIFAITDVCVASSIREGLGLNIVEAQFAGVPVIASRNRGHQDLVTNGENGLLIDVLDEKKWARAMYKMMVSQELRERYSKAAKVSSIKYSRNHSLEMIDQIYNGAQ